MYLLDTNVISEVRKARPHGGVISWIDGVRPGDMHLSAVVVGELQTGIERIRPHDASKAAQFDGWLTKILQSYSVIPMDGETFRIWARLMIGRQEHLYEDAMIAATALRHGLTVATRNTRDFEMFSVPLVNPFAAK
jgi:predicted nucleic acid-binding protein